MTFICKVLKFSFLDGGHFGGHFEFINPQIFEVEIKIVFNLSKPYSVPNLKLVSIWDTLIENDYIIFFCYISMSYSTLKMTFSGDLDLES